MSPMLVCQLILTHQLSPAHCKSISMYRTAVICKRWCPLAVPACPSLIAHIHPPQHTVMWATPACPHDSNEIITPHRPLIPLVCSVQRGSKPDWFLINVMRAITIVLSGRHFLICVDTSVWGSLVLCFADGNIPPVYITHIPTLSVTSSQHFWSSSPMGGKDVFCSAWSDGPHLLQAILNPQRASPDC